MSNRPRVLLLGDSIRMNYQPLVQECLADEADVTGPADNCQFSLYTLSSLNRWLTQLGEPAIVHWNNGIHDCGRNPNRCPKQIPLAHYEGNLRHLLQLLRGLPAKVIWASSTPVHPQRPQHSDQWAWRNEDIIAYNAAAAQLMQAETVPINDLHTLVWNHYDGYLCEDMLHLSDAGKAACAQAVAASIREALNSN